MLLKVQCEKCKTKYKLEESRVQGKGAKITCPKCRHVFVVMKDALNDSEGADDSGELQDSASESVGTGAVAPVTFANAPARPVEPPPPAAPVSAEVELGVTRPTSSESLNWKEVGLTTFKVKVAIGLVYDFSDIGTLRKYIAEKRVAATDRISFDGKTWTVIKDVPDLDAFFIDQWVALKVERLKEEKSGKRPTSPGTSTSTGPTGPVFGEPKRSEKKANTRTTTTAAGGEGDGGGRKSAWSADAGGEGAGLFGQDLFDDMNGAEDSAGLGALAAKGAGQSKNQTARRTAVPVPEPRNAAAATTAAREPVRLPTPMPSSGRRGLKVEELAFLGLLLCAVGYLGWRLIDEAGAAEVAAPPDKATQSAEVDQFVKRHFPLSFTGGGDSSGSTGSNGAGDAGTGAAAGGSSVKPEGRPGDAGQSVASVPAGAQASKDGGKEAGKADPARPDASKTDPSKPDAAKPDAGKTDTAKAEAGKKGSSKGAVEVGAITAEDLFQLGQESLRNKDYAAAVGSLQAAVGMKPGNANFQYTLGYALLQSGQDSDAEQAFKKASGAKKEAFKWLGEIYARRGQKDQAKEAWQKYLQTSPRDAQAIQKKIEQL